MDSSKKGMMTKRLATSKSSIFSFLHFYGAIISLSYCLQGVRTDSHQLLVYEKASKRFQLREDVLALMDPLPSPIFIISAVGNARIGKSTTMNCIQYLWNEKCDGFKQSFKTSDNQTPETRGVWMKMLSWKEQQNASVVFLDVEGTNAGDSSVIDNFSLFTGLLSSEIMAFTGKYVENHILDFFYRISKLLDGMVEYNKLETLGLPSLRVVQIGALKTCGKTQRDHVADALIKPFHDDGHDKQRESIRKYFPREKIQASKLMYLQSDSLNILEEFHLHYQTDYGKQIQKLVADLKTVLPKRTLRKSLIDGKSFVDIVKKLVNAMNTNFWEDFGNQYKAIEKQICNNAAETYLEDLQDKSASDIEKMKNERIRQFEIKCKLQEETDRRIKNVEKILLKKRELEEEVRKQVESERKRAEEEKRRKIAEEKLIEQQKEQARKVKLAEEAMAAEVRRRKEEEEKRRQERKVDRNTCIWLTGRYGQDLACPRGYIGTGACGSGRDADCRARGRAWTELECCQIQGDISNPHSCNDQGKRWGHHNVCPPGKAIYHLCGSGRDDDCSRGVWTRIRCCSDNAIEINSNSCTGWKYGHYGTYLTCEYGYVLAGVCGSGKDADCPGRTFHGIYCCKHQ